MCMCYAVGMSVLERRLQVLLDEGRMARLSDEAQRENRSVGSIIREAIDMRWAQFDVYVDIRQRKAAAEFRQRCLTVRNSEPPFDLTEFNREYEAEFDKVLVT